MNEMFESGLNILRREVREISADDWKGFEDLMSRAQQHVVACGCDWACYASSLKREFAELMKL